VRRIPELSPFRCLKMIASPMAASFLPSEPILIVPSHNLGSPAGRPMYFANPMSLAHQGLQAMPAYFETAPNFSAAPMQTMFPTFTRHQATVMHMHTSEMAVDEPVPTSPSSSNSTDADEYVARATATTTPTSARGAVPHHL